MQGKTRDRRTGGPHLTWLASMDEVLLARSQSRKRKHTPIHNQCDLAKPDNEQAKHRPLRARWCKIFVAAAASCCVSGSVFVAWRPPQMAASNMLRERDATLSRCTRIPTYLQTKQADLFASWTLRPGGTQVRASSMPTDVRGANERECVQNRFSSTAVCSASRARRDLRCGVARSSTDQPISFVGQHRHDGVTMMVCLSASRLSSSRRSSRETGTPLFSCLFNSFTQLRTSACIIHRDVGPVQPHARLSISSLLGRCDQAHCCEQTQFRSGQ